MAGSVKRPVRILFATTHEYLPQLKGGSETATHDLCVELGSAGATTAVLASLSSAGLLGLHARVRRELSRRYDFVRDRRMGYPVYRGYGMWNAPARGASEVVERFRPDVAVVQAGRAVTLADALLSTGTPTLLYIHDVEFDRMGGDPGPRDGLAFLANSRFTATRARERFGIEANVLPPFIRPEAYRTSTSRERVLFVNPHPWKGVETALNLAERRPDIPFDFVESWHLGGERHQRDRERARPLENVSWRASVSDMRTVYRNAKLILAPSVWEEAWCRVVTEGQASGIPVLASDRGGLPESVGPGGILIDHHAPPSAWERALGSLWDDPDAYESLSRKALQHSRRPEIQPANLAARFLRIVDNHVR